MSKVEPGSGLIIKVKTEKELAELTNSSKKCRYIRIVPKVKLKETQQNYFLFPTATQSRHGNLNLFKRSFEISPKKVHKANSLNVSNHFI